VVRVISGEEPQAISLVDIDDPVIGLDFSAGRAEAGLAGEGTRCSKFSLGRGSERTHRLLSIMVSSQSSTGHNPVFARSSVIIGSPGAIIAWNAKFRDQRAYIQKTFSDSCFAGSQTVGTLATSAQAATLSIASLSPCKTRFCPSCGKVKVDNWVNDITKDMLEVPHLHITLTTDDSFRSFLPER